MNQTLSRSQSHNLGESSGEIDFLGLFGTLWDHRAIIAAITTLFAMAGIVYALLAQPVYKANAVIQVEKKSQSLSGIGEMSEVFGATSAAVTEIELLKSRSIIGAAVDKLDLDIYAQPDYFPKVGNAISRRFTPSQSQPINSAPLGLIGYAWGGEKIALLRFEVPESQRGRAHQLLYQGEGRYTLLSAHGKTLLEGAVGEEVTESGYNLYIEEIAARPNTRFHLRKQHRLSTILYYQQALTAYEKGRDTGIIALELNGTDPARAEQILNEIAKTYIRKNVERQSAEAAKSLQFLRDQLPEVRKNLESAEQKLNEYQVRAGSVNISAEAQSLLSQVVEIESAIAELQLQKSELERKYTPDHPTYKAWQEQLAERQRRREEMDRRVRNLPETQQDLLGLKRDLEVSTAIYTQMLNNIQALDIVRAGTVGNVRIVDEAAVNLLAPVKPKKKLIVLIATVLGGVCGIALILIKTLLNRGIENPADIEAIGLPVYASVPLSECQLDAEDKLVRKLGRKERKKRAFPTFLLAERNPADIAIESLRSLRTSLHFAMMDARNNIIMISGPSPGVGKSFVSGNLGAVIAQSGQRVLLIDSDMRKGYLHRMFAESSEQGLSECLAGQLEFENAVRTASQENLSLITHGQIPPNPSELLMGRRLKELLDWAAESYDLVIVDTPPILAVTDAAIVGRNCAINMIVTRFGLNPLKELEATRSRFEQNGIEVKGVIFNATERRASAYGYGNYTYEYKNKA